MFVPPIPNFECTPFLPTENSRSPTPYALAILNVASPPIARLTTFVVSPPARPVIACIPFVLNVRPFKAIPFESVAYTPLSPPVIPAPTTLLIVPALCNESTNPSLLKSSVPSEFI